MSTPGSGPRPLALLGGFLLGMGFASRILISPATSPVVQALPTILLLAGSGLVLLEGGLEGTAGLPLSLLLLPLFALPGFFPFEAGAALRGGDLVALVAAGLALRELCLREDLAPVVLRSLLAMSTLVALLALAQALFQRAEVEAYAHRMGDALTATARGRAFLASKRVAATFVNANVLGGFLLLVLPLAIATASPRNALRWRGGLLVLLFGAAFVAAGSAGATLALAAGAAALLLLCRPFPAGRGWRVLAGGGAIMTGLAIIVLTVSLASDWEPPLVGSKVATFRERVDYHRIGLRLLPDTGLFGAGLGSTSERSPAVVRPGESWSAFLHDSWLQLLLEIGPLLLVPVFLLLRGLRRAGRAPPSRATAGPAPALGRAFQIGCVLGALLVPVVVRAVTLLPTSADLPLLDAVLAGAVVATSLRLLAPLAEPAMARTALLWGLAAFVLHNCVDFDLYVPGCAIGFVAILTLLPGRPRPSEPWRRAAAGLQGVALLALPLVLMPIAVRADEVLAARGATDEALRFEVIARAASATPPHLDALRPALIEAVRRGEVTRAEELLDRLPPRLRERSRVRRAEAHYLQLRALADRRFAPEARDRITALIRDRELAGVEIWYHRHVVDVVLSHAAAATSARAALALAAEWEVQDEGAPYLGELRRHVEDR